MTDARGQNEYKVRSLVVSIFDVPGLISVSHGYGFPRGFHLVVYTGTGTDYQMSEPHDTVPVGKVLRCLAVYLVSEGLCSAVAIWFI